MSGVSKVITAVLVHTLECVEQHDPDELLSPDEIMQMSAVAPSAPRRRRARPVALPRELTDSEPEVGS